MSPAHQVIPHAGLPHPLILLGAGEHILTGLDYANGLTFLDAVYNSGPAVVLEFSSDQGGTWEAAGPLPRQVKPGEWVRITRTDTSQNASLIAAVFDFPVQTYDLSDLDYRSFALVQKTGVPLHFQYRDGTGTLYYSPVFTTTPPGGS